MATTSFEEMFKLNYDLTWLVTLVYTLVQTGVWTAINLHLGLVAKNFQVIQLNRAFLVFSEYR